MPQSQTHYRTCNLCEAMCGLKITHNRGKILSIRGDEKDSFSKGFICPKAPALQDIHEDKDRLKQPLLKTAGGWQQVSWETAFSETVSRIQKIQSRHGNDAVATYLGNPNVHNHGTLLTIFQFLHTLKTENRFSATSVDQLAPMLVNLKMFGNQALFPVPDIDHTDFFLCIGANPIASNGSLMSAPGVKNRLRKIQQRGGKVIVVDPRRTETAKVADQHLFIQPGSDALLLMALIHTLFEDGLLEPGRLRKLTKGADRLQRISSVFTPEAVENHTGIPARQIRKIAQEISAAKSACCYSRVGTSTQAFGSISTWLCYALNLITGNMDKRGGMMFPRPAIDLAGLANLLELTGSFGTRRSRVSKLPEFAGEYPAVTLAEEMLTEGPGQIRGLVTVAGNPVLSLPNGKQLERALDGLEFMVSIDFYLNETTSQADIILPPTGPLEHSHYDLALHSIAVRNTAKYSPALFPPEEDAHHDWQIFLELTKRLANRSPVSWAKAELNYQAFKKLGADGMLDLLLRTGPFGTPLPGLGKMQQRIADIFYKLTPSGGKIHRVLDIGPYSRFTRSRLSRLTLNTLKQQPHGVNLGPLQPSLPDRLATRRKKINLVPRIFVEEIPRLQEYLKQETNTSLDTLKLIGRRHVRSNNSWMHNSYRLVSGKNRCTAQLHPEDARKLNIKDGDFIAVSSRVGEIQLPAEVTDDIMEGVISIPHGWGHTRAGIRLGVAKKTAGASINDITDERVIDPLTGVAAFSGQPVAVKKEGVSKIYTLNRKLRRIPVD